MIRLNRRTVLKGTATLGAAASVPLAATMAQAAVRLVVFDSSIAESASFASSLAGGHRLDLADAHTTQWAALRGALPQVSAVEGLTGWSDWIAVRGELQARGLRLSSEMPVAAPLSGKAHLFRWSMMAR